MAATRVCVHAEIYSLPVKVSKRHYQPISVTKDNTNGYQRAMWQRTKHKAGKLDSARRPYVRHILFSLRVSNLR